MLDPVSYLTAYGWQGKGSGLRQGARSAPLILAQKKTLSGLGKDRDEAFPFWDHVFTTAAKTIKIKVHRDDSDAASDVEDAPEEVLVLARTSTGIISNRRPTVGASGASTPDLVTDTTTVPPLIRLPLLAQAKRDAARRTLYARFLRGPVIGPSVELPPPALPVDPVVTERPSKRSKRKRPRDHEEPSASARERFNTRRRHSGVSVEDAPISADDDAQQESPLNTASDPAEGEPQHSVRLTSSKARDPVAKARRREEREERRAARIVKRQLKEDKRGHRQSKAEAKEARRLARHVLS